MPSRKPTAAKMTLTSDEDFRKFQNESSSSGPMTAKRNADKPKAKARPPVKPKGAVVPGRDDIRRISVYVTEEDALEVSEWCKQNYVTVSAFAARAMRDEIRRQKGIA